MSGFQHGLGDLLYESGSIAFDTVSKLFVNPQTGTTYGPTPPAGGWPISWYESSSGQVVAPTGPGAVSQTADQAAALVSKVVQQLSAQSHSTEAQPVPETAASSVAASSSNPPPAQSSPASSASTSAQSPAVPLSTTGFPSGDIVYTIPGTNAEIDITQLWNNYWWVLVAGGAIWFFFFSGKRR